MKIAAYLRTFLEEFNYLQLAGIGKFEIHDSVTGSSQGFSYNRKLLEFYPQPKRMGHDDALVDFLCSKCGIDRYLVISDLDYFSSSCLELVMQGLEAEIPGIGFLNLDENKLQFAPRSRYYTSKQRRKRYKPAPAMSFWY